MPPAARSAGGRWSASECSPAEPMSWDRMRYILWDNNCSVPPRIHMTPFTAAAAAAELPASSGKARAQASGALPPRTPPPSPAGPQTLLPRRLHPLRTPTPASASPPRLRNAQSARARAARRSASGGEGPAERAAPRPPRAPGPALGPAPASTWEQPRAPGSWRAGLRFFVRPCSPRFLSSTRKKRDSPTLPLRPLVH